jgi:hypothetical protein
MQSPLAYIFKELNVRTIDWKPLPDKDKDELKRWAAEEQAAIAREKAS